jgi:hypothetical protein
MNRSCLILTATAISCSVGDCFGDDFDDDTGYREQECDQTESTLVDLAGYSSTDCGTAVVSDEKSTVDACAVDSFENGESFRARYTWSDGNAGGQNAWAGDGKRVYIVQYLTNDSHDVLSYVECLAPSVPANDSGGSGNDDSGNDADQFGMFLLECGQLGPVQALCDSRNN